jgi:hypothetical protein
MDLALPLLVFALLALPALRLWRLPTRGAAETTVAGFFLASGLGFALRLQAVADGSVDRPFEIALNAAGHAGLSLACVALFAFTRRIFRPDEAWARLAFWAASAGSLLALAGLALDGGYRLESADSLLAVNAFRTAAYGWTFVEALRYWRLSQRRLRLGLVDVVVANRFLLWSVWSGGLTLCFGFVLVTRIAGRLTGIGAEVLPAVFPVIRVVLGAAVLTSAAAIWLCFFAPAWYRGWLQRTRPVAGV